MLHLELVSFSTLVQTISIAFGVGIAMQSSFTIADEQSKRSFVDASDNTYVHLEGRAEVLGEQIRVAFPGVKLQVAITGQRLGMIGKAWSDSVYLDVIVDGQLLEPIRLPSGAFNQTLFRGTEGEHLVEIYKRTEGWQGVLEVSTFHVSGGHFRFPPPSSKRKLLFIGDSITAGTGADASSDDQTNGNQTTNGRIAYGRVLADRLGAQCQLVAYGGRGLVRDWEGRTDTGTAPEFYERTLPDDPESSWDPSKYVPDAVSICLGTNDFNRGIVSTKQYVSAYVHFLKKIRRDFPDAHFFLLTSPMYGQMKRREVLNEYIDRTIAMLGDAKVTKIDVGYYPGRPGIDSHPIASEHKQIARELEPVFRKELGW